MIRSISEIAQAILLAWSGFDPGLAGDAAAHLRNLAAERRFDPLTAVAIVENESRGVTSAIGPAGEVGLGQIKPRDADHAAALLDWRTNLTATAGAFVAWREFCRKRVGTARAAHWLSGYQGYDFTRGTTCGHKLVRGRWVAQPIRSLTRKVLTRRAELARRFS